MLKTLHFHKNIAGMWISWFWWTSSLNVTANLKQDLIYPRYSNVLRVFNFLQITFFKCSVLTMLHNLCIMYGKMNRTVDGWRNEWMEGWIERWMGGRMNGEMNGWKDGFREGWKDEWRDEWMDGWIERWMGGRDRWMDVMCDRMWIEQMNGEVKGWIERWWVEGWMDKWMDGRMDVMCGRMDRTVDEWRWMNGRMDVFFVLATPKQMKNLYVTISSPNPEHYVYFCSIQQRGFYSQNSFSTDSILDQWDCQPHMS